MEKKMEMVRAINRTLIIKRILDVIISLIGIVICSPVLFIIYFLILFSDFRNPIFKQLRYGLNGKLFYIYKFRSMVKNGDEVLRKNDLLYQKYIQNNYKLQEFEDPRITKVGRFLRKTSLDELPQLFNVLRGEMSIVGWRPIVEEEIKEYGSKSDVLFSMKPGVTGYWQVSGRSDIGYPERVDIELFYHENHSLALDFKIVCKTFVSVLRKDGAY